MTTEIAQAPPAATPAEPAPAPAGGIAAPPPAPVKAPTKPTAEEALAKFDAEFDALSSKAKVEIADGDDEPAPVKKAAEPEATKEEAKPEAEAEAGAEDPSKQEGEWEEGVVPPSPETALPPNMRAALKAIKDPEIRKQLARDHFLAKGYARSGMRLSDISRYVAAAPTPEILDERMSRASQLDSFVDEFGSGDQNATYRVAEVLRQTSPEGWTRLVDAIIDNIPTVRPEKLRVLGGKFFRAAVTDMRAKAEKDGDLVLADHADGLEEFLGLKASAKAKGQRDETREDPDLKRRLEEADEITRREKQRETESVQQAYQAFNGAVVNAATTEGVSYIRDWIEENCGAYSNDAKAELFDRMAGSVLEQVRGNAHVTKTLQRLMDDGSGDEAHLKRCADYLVRTSRSVFVTVAPQVLGKFQKVFGQATARRMEKVVRAQSSRDIGSSGAVAVAQSQRLVGKGKHAEDVLKEFDALGG